MDDWYGQPGIWGGWAKLTTAYVGISAELLADTTAFSDAITKLCQKIDALDPEMTGCAGPGQPEGDDSRPARQQDPCPQCAAADLEPFGAKMRCPACGYLQPCCDPG